MSFNRLLALAVLLATGTLNAQTPALDFFNPILQTSADQQFSLFGLRANRNNQIATLYKPDRSGADHLVFYGEGLFAEHTVIGSRYVDLTFSNWGAVLWNFGGDGTGLASAPIGEAPADFFRSTVSNSKGAVNDNGSVAFFAREDIGHGLRDAYLRLPGEPPTPLPDMGEVELFSPALIDELGRVVARHHIGAASQTDFYRYTDDAGWENLTAGKLPSNVSISSSVSVQGDRAISQDGDFVFEVIRTTSEGQRIPEVYLWDDELEAATMVFNNGSVYTDFFGDPYGMNVEANFSDAKDLFIIASRSGAGLPREFRQQYRKADGTVVDIASLLPDGETLVPSVFGYAMNYDGDVWLSTQSDETGLYSYFFYQDERLYPVLQGIAGLIESPVLTNSHEVYAWLKRADGRYELGHFQVSIPEPSSLAAIAFALLLVNPSSARQRHIRRKRQ